MKYLINYTKIGIFKTTFIITVIIFCIFNNIFSKVNATLINNKSYVYEVVNYEESKKQENENIINNTNNQEEQEQEKEILINESFEITTEENITKDNINQAVWEIEIPIINLIAKISEGTDKATMDKYVGHFAHTSIYNR